MFFFKKVNDLTYRAQNESGFANVSTNRLGKSNENTHAFWRTFQTMWIAIAKFAIRIPNLNPDSFKLMILILNLNPESESGCY